MTAAAAETGLTPCTERVEDGTCGVAVDADGKHWPRATVADPTLEHQIRIDSVGWALTVSCNCRGPRYKPFGRFLYLNEAWALYNAHLPAEATT